MKRFFLIGAACLAMAAATITVAGAQAPNYPRFAVRVIDETADGRSTQGPPAEDRLPLATRGLATPGFLWLKREGGFDGRFIAEAHVGQGADGQPTADFTFTPEGTEKFLAVVRANVGHRIAIVANGVIVTTTLIAGTATDGQQLQISGYFTEAEARDLVAELIATNN